MYNRTAIIPPRNTNENFIAQVTFGFSQKLQEIFRVGFASASTAGDALPRADVPQGFLLNNGNSPSSSFSVLRICGAMCRAECSILDLVASRPACSVAPISTQLDPKS